MTPDPLPADIDLKDSKYVARVLKLSGRTIWNLFQENVLPGAVKIRGRWYLPLSALQQIAREGIPVRSKTAQAAD